MRDKWASSMNYNSSGRIIPAYAGQILLVALISMVCWDHPRIRGTNTLQSFFYSFPLGSPPHTRDKFEVEVIAEIADRITPAYAGQITSRVQGGGSNRDHPRIRGTNGMER